MPAGVPIDGYYPAVIDRETFETVQGIKGRGAVTASNSAAATARPPLGNLLAELAACPLCGSTMTRVSKGARKRQYLVCVKAKRGDGCEYRAVRCDQIEDTIAEKAEEFAITMPAEDAHLEQNGNGS